MRERPILFNRTMVRAIIAGRKTQTRRPVKPPRGVDPEHWMPSNNGTDNSQVLRDGTVGFVHWPGDHAERGRLACPYGGAGDRLWVRETWGMSYADIAHGRPHTIGGTWGSPSRPDRVQCAVYRADDPAMPDDSPMETARWRPSIHMPRWASRLSLPVVGMRVERVQGISEADAIAEGVEPVEDPFGEGSDDYWRCYRKHCGGRDASDCGGVTSARASFETLWQATYGAESWSRNDWVWVVEWAPLVAAVRAQLGGGR